MRITKAASLWVVLFLVAAASVHSETLYKWTDSQGVQRFSNQRPPEDVDVYETIEGTREPSSSDAQRPEYRQMLNRVEQENRQSEAQARQIALERANEAQRKARAERKARIDAERQVLEQQIEELKNRGLSPTFSQGMRQAQIEKIEKQIDELEASGK